MKKLYSIVLILSGIWTVSSCDDFMDVHKEYIKGGEIIYAPKPDTVYFIAGKERILFVTCTYNSPNVKSIDVYWNAGKDSLIVPVTLGTGYDTTMVIVDDMPEQSYTFNVRTTDNFGHKSLYLTNFGSSYGENYQATLNQRRVKRTGLLDGGGCLIEWFSPLDGMIRNEIRYTKTDGTIALARMVASDYTINLPDAKLGSEFEIRSLYIPETEAIDTFATEWITCDIPFPYGKLDRTGWSVLAVSDETASDGGGKDVLLDNNLNNWWHSQWDGGNAPCPHWAVIDMLTPKVISNVELYRRPGNTDAKTVQVFVNNVPDAADAGWEQIATGIFGSGDGIFLTVPKAVDTKKGRYLKILLPDSNRDPFTSIAEIYVYGQD